MKNYSPFLLIFLLFAFNNCGGQKRIRSTEYTYTIPAQLADSIAIGNLQEVGIDSLPIIQLTQLILADTFPNIHSLLIYKNNKLVYENYFAGKDEEIGRKLGYIEHGLNDLHDCRSITKSITSACIGIAVKNGFINNIDHPIASYFPQYAKHFTGQKQQITIRHLLNMTSGLEWNEDISYRDPRNSELQMDGSADPIEFIISRNMVAAPGTTWNYNGGNTQLLAQIIQKVSGQNIAKFAEQHLFKPLGIQQYEWRSLYKDVPAAASGLRLRSRDLLKFGTLYMHEGAGIVTPNWVKQSLQEPIKRPSKRDSDAGYGFQYWTYTINGIPIQEAKGNGGQRIFFCQQYQLLVVITAGNYNNWDIINDSKAAFEKYILPAMQ